MKQAEKHSNNRVKVIFIIVGIIVTIINYVAFLILAPIFGNGNWSTWAGAGSVAVITALILHSCFTWRHRKSGRNEGIKFLVYNLFLITALQPFLGWFFSSGIWDWLYDLAFWVTSWVGWSIEFVYRTGIFGLTAIITMVVNFLVYDRLVFKINR